MPALLSGSSTQRDFLYGSILSSALTLEWENKSSFLGSFQRGKEPSQHPGLLAEKRWLTGEGGF